MGEPDVGPVTDPVGVADDPLHPATGHVAQVVVDGDRSGVGAQQPVDGGGPGRVMQARDEDNRDGHEVSLQE
ncbi:hypothetical protein Pph01_72250 [Planotetraspora phitsanulokensis]|uniref:Uncharacterized protein n=1 Tax=Planotetraspora phitsanulokensis TaxID=575192 RepID=A0A8J3UEJ8_9ACTN|nr:hypothetical protein Pph01_72250 [Planotetraspora phitsanulokensis]